MDWLAANFTKYPELPVFLLIGIGCWIGGLKFRGFGLGPATGSLMAGVLVGYFFQVPVAIGNILLTTWSTVIVRLLT